MFYPMACRCKNCKNQWPNVSAETETENDMHQDENLGTACEKLDRLTIDPYAGGYGFDLKLEFSQLSLKEVQALQALLLKGDN